MSETLIKVEGVSKKFCRSLKKSLWYGIQDLSREITGRQHGGDGELRPDEFWAVKDVSFELKRGECLGLIGRNGAGKTTLLRMLNGLIKPDSGKVEMRGRVGALIALGAGFNPILTGRENIYVNGSVLGLSQEQITKHLEEIVEFSGLVDFIDTPIQSYSSGMQVRLGFSIAACIKPDILIIDEALAVGDIEFRSKCFNKIRTHSKESSVILVSHNKQDIQRVCTKGLLLENGYKKSIGSIQEITVDYENLLFKKNEQRMFSAIPGVQILRIESNSTSLSTGDSLFIELEINSNILIRDSHLRMSFLNSQGDCVAEYRNESNETIFNINKGQTILTKEIKNIRLTNGSYCVNLIIYNDMYEYIALAENAFIVKFFSKTKSLAAYLV